MTQPVVEPDAAPETFGDAFGRALASIETIIRGKTFVVHMALVCLIAEGHLLIEDVPGVGKTQLAKALARTLGCRWQRLQFTPDLLPSDVTGVSVFNRGSGAFEFRAGPVFTNIVLADEINRASPKTQAALLEAMEERQVTVDGVTRTLHEPFMVIATQNPLEHEGTYPLPESQLDRFLMRLDVGYPAREAELAILDTHGGLSPVADLEPVLSPAAVGAMIRAARGVHTAPSVKAYIIDVADATRRSADLIVGVSPRGCLALLRASRALAASLGREYVTPDDVKSLAVPVLGHRVIVRPEASLRGRDAAAVITDSLGAVAVPGARRPG